MTKEITRLFENFLGENYSRSPLSLKNGYCKLAKNYLPGENASIVGREGFHLIARHVDWAGSHVHLKRTPSNVQEEILVVGSKLYKLTSLNLLVTIPGSTSFRYHTFLFNESNGQWELKFYDDTTLKATFQLGTGLEAITDANYWSLERLRRAIAATAGFSAPITYKTAEVTTPLAGGATQNVVSHNYVVGDVIAHPYFVSGVPTCIVVKSQLAGSLTAVNSGSCSLFTTDHVKFSGQFLGVGGIPATNMFPQERPVGSFSNPTTLTFYYFEPVYFCPVGFADAHGNCMQLGVVNRFPPTFATINGSSFFTTPKSSYTPPTNLIPIDAGADYGQGWWVREYDGQNTQRIKGTRIIVDNLNSIGSGGSLSAGRYRYAFRSGFVNKNLQITYGRPVTKVGRDRFADLSFTAVLNDSKDFTLKGPGINGVSGQLEAQAGFQVKGGICQTNTTIAPGGSATITVNQGGAVTEFDWPLFDVGDLCLMCGAITGANNKRVIVLDVTAVNKSAKTITVSNPRSLDLGTSVAADFDVGTRVSAGAFFEVFRTKVDGVEYYLENADIMSLQSGSMSYLSTMADSDLIIPLPSQLSGEEDDHPQDCKLISQHRGRLVGCTPEEFIIYSKADDVTSFPSGVNEFFTNPSSYNTGAAVSEITSLKSDDLNSMLITKPNAVYALDGDLELAATRVLTEGDYGAAGPNALPMQRGLIMPLSNNGVTALTAGNIKSDVLQTYNTKIVGNPIYSNFYSSAANLTKLEGLLYTIPDVPSGFLASQATWYDAFFVSYKDSSLAVFTWDFTNANSGIRPLASLGNWDRRSIYLSALGLCVSYRTDDFTNKKYAYHDFGAAIDYDFISVFESGNNLEEDKIWQRARIYHIPSEYEDFIPFTGVISIYNDFQTSNSISSETLSIVNATDFELTHNIRRGIKARSIAMRYRVNTIYNRPLLTGYSIYADAAYEKDQVYERN